MNEEDIIPTNFETPEDALKFYKGTPEKRKCMKCGEKKEKGNGNVFFCNKCRPIFISSEK
jgi:hypothetical protein